MRHFSILLFLCFLFFSFNLNGQTATSPANGDGSEANPYEITTLENLYWLSQNEMVWSDHFVQTADINASTSVSWANDSGFTTIGNQDVAFSGVYNGNGHTIDSIYINRPDKDKIGLFGAIDGGEVKNLGIINANITANNSIGVLAGSTNNATNINNCYSSGNASGTNKIGGLIGEHNYSSTITNSYSKTTVSGEFGCGGLVGANYAQIQLCYSTGKVTGSSYTGGLVGFSYGGTCANAFWNTETSGQSNSDGGTGLSTSEMQDGLTYYNDGWDIINETINGTQDIWGLDSLSNNALPFLWWQNHTHDTSLVVATDSVLVYDKPSSTALLDFTIYDFGGSDATAHGLCWNTSGNPTINDNKNDLGSTSTTDTYHAEINNLTYGSLYFVRAFAINANDTVYGNEIIFSALSPELPTGDGSQANPYQIASLENLLWLSENEPVWTGYFIQTANINASIVKGLNNEQGFSPIGNASTPFTGSYDGQGYTIDSLIIQKEKSNLTGLFGNINGCTIQNLGLTNVAISGNIYTGGLVGSASISTINNCFVTGSVSGSENVGGITGYNENSTNINSCYNAANTGNGIYVGGITGNNNSSMINNSYNKGNIEGQYCVGGIAGQNKNSDLNYCFSTGVISAASDFGGLVGYSYDGIVNHSFWDIDASGVETSGGGTGLSTSNMKTASTYYQEGWDFMNETVNGTQNYWGFNSEENNGYPFLQWEGFTHNPPLIINTSSVQVNSGSDVTVNAAIIELGSPAPTQHGVVWNTSGEPTIEDNTTTEGVPSSTGSFSSDITGLNPNTAYYVRAYAVNDNDTVYGKEMTFATIIPIAPPGMGTEASPYAIIDINNLYWLSQSDTEWASHYIQMVDIDASAVWAKDNGKGFSPIGNNTTKFTGSYNGQGFSIDKLTVFKPDNQYVGLFGYTNNATIQNLSLINVKIEGDSHVGALIGTTIGSTISGCMASGNVKANNYTAGGLVGWLNSYSVLDSCYSETNVESSSMDIGGLVGHVNYYSEVVNSYSTGSVSGSARIGGLVGSLKNNSVVNSSYSIGEVSGSSSIGGLVGDNSGTVNNSFWDTEKSGLATSAGGMGLTSSEMKTETTFTDAGWDFEGETTNGNNDTWDMDNVTNSGYPHFTSHTYSQEVATVGITDTMATSVVSEGDIITLGMHPNVEYGFCWNTAGNPTISDSKIFNGPATESSSYTMEISGLEPVTTYYIRAYITNSIDETTYGDEVIVTTEPKELSINGSFTVADKTYSGTTSATITDNSLELTGVLSGDNVSLTDVNAQFIQSDVGSHIVVSLTNANLTGSDAEKYILSMAGAPSTTGSINPAELLINGSFIVSDKIYDGTNSAEIIDTSLVLDGIIGDDTVSLSNPVAQFAQAVAGNNINATLLSAELSGTDKTNYTLSLSESPIYSNGVINKTELTVTPDNQTKVYGEANPQLTFQYAGFVNGEDETVLSTQPAASTTVDQTTGVGTYQDAITISGGVADNYSINYLAADFEVTAKELTVTPDNQSKVYGEANPQLTFQYAGFVNGEDETVLSTAPAASTTIDQTTGVGTYQDAITISGGVADNYSFNYLAADFEVTAKELTVTPDNQSKVYGEANPELTFQYAGFVNGEDETVISTAPAASTIVDQTTGVGTYQDAITISGGVADNYSFNYLAADFEVTAKELTIAGSFSVNDKTPDGTNDAIIDENNLTLEGLLFGDVVDLINVEIEFAQAEAGKDIEVSIVSADIGGIDSDNYTLSLEDAPIALADIIAEYTLTLNVSGNGTVTVNDEVYSESLTFMDGDSIKLEAEADANWQFSGWSGDLESSTNSVSLVINQDMSISVEFEAVTGFGEQTQAAPKVWPNPFCQSIRFDQTDQISQIDIFTITGEKVCTLLKPVNTINTEEYHKGIYIIKLTNKNGSVHTYKLLKQ